MTNNKLLIDVDGVIIRDKALLGHMRHKIQRYVQKKVPGRDPVKLNDMLYTKYGHTARGLTKEFGIDTRDFNDEVYDHHLISHLFDFINADTEFKNDIKVLREIAQHHCDIELFSNAPLVWTIPISFMIGYGCVSKDQYDKPDMESYSRFFDNTRIIFVDDMIHNLLPVLFFDNWTPIHFSNEKESNFVETVGSLSELKNVLTEILDDEEDV